MDRVGFIGLGNMGSGVCNSLIRNGYPTTVYDLSADAREKYKNKASIASSGLEVFKNSDCIFLSLPSSKIVEDLLEQFLDEGVEGKTIIDLSTCFPISTRSLYQKVKDNGGVFVDAPLSGMPEDGESGTLLVMFGGDKEQYTKLEPMMKSFCKEYHYLGESGAGHIAKIILNFIGLSYVITYAQAFPLTEKLGLDNHKILALLKDSGMNCGVLDFYAEKMISKTYDMAFALELALKDLTYCKKLFEEYEVPGFSLDGTLDLLRIGIKDGRGKNDYSECAAVVYDFFKGK